MKKQKTKLELINEINNMDSLNLYDKLDTNEDSHDYYRLLEYLYVLIFRYNNLKLYSDSLYNDLNSIFGVNDSIINKINNYLNSKELKEKLQKELKSTEVITKRSKI